MRVSNFSFGLIALILLSLAGLLRAQQAIPKLGWQQP